MDFQQGLITTIHEYGVTRNLLKELNKSLKKRSTSILIPCLYEEFERPALKDIREVLKDLTGLNELVIALSAKTVEQVKATKSFFNFISHKQNPVINKLNSIFIGCNT